MSEISVISNQYKTVVNTTDKVNNSIIALKKRNLGHSAQQMHPQLQLGTGELEGAKEYLIRFLSYVQNLSEEPARDNEFLPKSIVKDFLHRIVDSIPFFSNEVNRLAQAIQLDQELGKEQFNLLDKMAATLDSERTVLFRKLRTARG